MPPIINGEILSHIRQIILVFWYVFSAIAKKRMEENKKLNQSLQKYTIDQNQYIHKKEEVNNSI